MKRVTGIIEKASDEGFCIYSPDMEVEYKYDFSGFFKAFPFFNVTKFSPSTSASIRL